MKKTINLLCCISLIISCSTNVEKNDYSIVSGYDDGIIDQKTILPAFIKKIEVIPLKSTEEAIIANPEKITLSNNHYYILDNNRVLKYDQEGHFINSIGEKGNGNGEYISLSSFVIRNDTIKLFDSYKNSLLAYSADGHFLYEKKAPDGVLVNLKDAEYEKGDVLFISNYIFNSQNNVYTRWNTLTDEVSVVANALVQTDGTKETVGTHSFSVYEDNVRYVLPFSNVLNSTRHDALQFNTSKEVLAENNLKDIHDYSIMSYVNQPDIFLGFSNVFETEHYILLTYFNLEYTIVDKQTNKCNRFNYLLEDNTKIIPLMNIIASNGKALIGIVNLEEDTAIKDRLKDYLGESDITYEYVLIKYYTF